MPVIPDFENLDPGWTLVAGDRKEDRSNLGEWSSLIGIITAIVGNILIALALNVQRYTHLQLHKKKLEARQQAREAERRFQHGQRNSNGGTNSHASNNTQNNSATDDINDASETQPLTQSYQPGDSSLSNGDRSREAKSSNYLQSPSWWAGQILMTIGEMGNFLAYGFAPASIVSPLGVVALVSNCIIAPLFFGEIFRKRDFWGVVIAVAGAVVVVLSANQEETKLEPHDVWDAISTLAFEIYMAVSISLIVVLMWLSPKYGNRTILIDLGLVGLFGAYTALSTKGVSSMLSSTLWRAFTTPVTYVLLLILLGTAVMQVRYVNKALQRFDSTQVIPIQFVMFTLSVIIGSAVLYRDFERTNAHQAIKFVGGCLLTFFAVFLITSGRPRQDNDDDCLSDEEGIEETIGLSDQEANTGEGAKPNDERRQSVTRSSRRSSRVSFAARPQTIQHDSGVPSPRKPDAAGARAPITVKGTPTEASPLLTGPWDHHPHPGLPSAFSDESVVTIHSMTSTNTDPLPVDTTLPPQVIAPPSPSGRPRTPRPSFSSSRPHSHHLSNAIISPSPLSSTVSAVVGDGLLRDEDGVLIHKRSIRRLRPGFRSSLFVPYSDTEEIPEGDPLIRPATEELPAADGETSNQGNQSLRTRARSLSNTLGGLLSRKRHRRNTNPEAGLSRSHESTDEVDRADAPLNGR
ncbi:hypothetical protein PFICI_12930 [Pestalotiopsis fici W106-1]|uniref:Uncharacterized protein n=1 Tax=Pestalotiopsis fici (strain W106-1 / CGMCC3.15140) TaxID=1229662 RepID=W3WT33_PESFW|nr:uncharacterized protein PFICI_12930 [Pestalotiopsis fici W106-1]ETS75986.1 hypothetical protein PFICI_12930 [Pestalotiopsis fici W106-1]